MSNYELRKMKRLSFVIHLAGRSLWWPCEKEAKAGHSLGSPKLKADTGRIAGWTFVIGAWILLAIGSCSNKEETYNDTYTCPMHPTVISDRPGPCPVCGMDLVRKARQGEEIKITEDLSRLMKSPNEVVVSSIKTIKGVFRSVPVALQVTGIVSYDTRNIYSIPARVGGRLEKVYLKYNYQVVRQGQKVAEIYSPELVTAQRELLFLLENDPKNESLIQSAKIKLELLGLTATQINNLATRRRQQNTFAIYSAYNGYVITDDSAPSLSVGMSSPAPTGGGMGEMGGASATPSQPQTSSATQRASTSLIREGAYVSPGQTLFKIVNTSALRIELDLPVTDAGVVNVGDSATITWGQNEKRITTIDFVQPFFGEEQNFVKIRVYTAQTEGLQIGQLVKATINLRQKEALWVPREAVLDLGTQKVVFIKVREVLKPKRITTGIRTGDVIEIKSGLSTSDEIAANAHYLVDSESFIKPDNGL
jgi:hypothetical protein